MHRHLDEARPWDDRAQLLEIVRIAPEAPDVATFTFRAPEGSWFRYQPGQFVTLELPLPSGPQLRTYTLSSSPSRPLTIAVTVKAQAASVATRWMLDHLRVGDRLRAHGPAGAFTCHRHPADKYLFLSAGSGITPMMSMTRWLQDCGSAADIAFVTCARGPADLIFRRELEHAAAGPHPFALAFVVEGTEPGQAWTGFRGRLSRPVLEAVAPDFLDREAFCCGPAPFMAAAAAMLEAAGFDMRRYHEESFHPAEAPQPTGGGTERPLAGSVVFALSGLEAPAADGDTILAVARAAGLTIPTGCTMGLCGTCKLKCLAGETVMNHNGGIREEDIAAGYILPCCTRPLGRVEVEA